MLLLNCQSVSKAYGSQSLFSDLSLSIFTKDRIGLIGPNGAGKSTLMKILAGIERADSGEVALKGEVRAGYVPQENRFDDRSIFDLMKEASHCEHEYEREVEASIWISKLGFNDDQVSAQDLSGGWKKRLAIGLALIGNPDVLMLDEPTNHLDLESIEWLEGFLMREVVTLIVISHDRSFLAHSTNRTIEINPIYPGGLFNVDGDYLFFLGKKERFIAGQLEQERSIATKVRREQAWLRESPKARTTKADARIDQARALFEEHALIKMRNQVKRADIAFEGSERQTRKLLVCKNLKKAMGEKLLFEKLDLTVSGGLRLGLLGANGSGKTTLMRLLAGEIEPDQGTIKRAEDLKIVYFDQHRAKLTPGITLKEALSPSGDYVHFQERPIHVNGWCKRFLFPPEYLGMSIDKLSGGERARISIARLMLQPADILFLDEPTNDLDIPTLETLEENLRGFPGAVVLISHDRTLMQNVCTQFLSIAKTCEQVAAMDQVKVEKKVKKKPAKKKVRQSNQFETKIKTREKKIKELESELETNDLEKLQRVHQEIEALQAEVDDLMEQWLAADQHDERSR